MPVVFYSNSNIQYIIKLVEAGIDIKRPSATNHGTYLHAFLVRSKQTKNEDIIKVIRVMVEVKNGTTLRAVC